VNGLVSCGLKISVLLFPGVFCAVNENSYSTYFSECVIFFVTQSVF